MASDKVGGKAGMRMADRVYVDIRHNILTGKLLPGERITEELLAQRFGASRTPVRSAMVRLAGDGFVEMTPRSGSVVKQRSPGEIAEIYDVRALLESEAARLAAESRDRTDLEALKNVQAKLDEVASGAESDGRETVETLSMLNQDFHQAILHAARNSTLADSATRLMEIGFLINAYARFDRDEIERSLSDHRKLIVAIESGDGAWAKAIMRAHILGARNSLAKVDKGGKKLLQRRPRRRT